MVTFIVRRLIATVFILIIVSMVTFATFFLLPKLAGQTSYGLDLGALLGGAVLTEYTFSLHGLGLYTIKAIPSMRTTTTQLRAPGMRG